MTNECEHRRITEHRSTQRPQRVPVPATTRQQIQRRCGGQQVAQPALVNLTLRGQFGNGNGTRRQALEQAELYAGQQHLRMDEAAGHTKHSHGITPRKPLSYNVFFRPFAKIRAAEQPVLPVSKKIRDHSRHRCRLAVRRRPWLSVPGWRIDRLPQP